MSLIIFFLSEGGWGNVQRVYWNQIVKRFALLVSTISDTSVEVFAFCPAEDFYILSQLIDLHLQNYRMKIL